MGGWRPFPKHIFKKQKILYPLILTSHKQWPICAQRFDQAGYWTLWERREDWDKTPLEYCTVCPNLNMCFSTTMEMQKQSNRQANHNLDMTDLTMEAFRAILERNEYSRGYRKEYPWVVNVDPCMTGLTLNNDVSPFDLKDVRWALTLA